MFLLLLVVCAWADTGLVIHSGLLHLPVSYANLTLDVVTTTPDAFAPSACSAIEDSCGVPLWSCQTGAVLRSRHVGIYVVTGGLGDEDFALGPSDLPCGESPPDAHILSSGSRGVAWYTRAATVAGQTQLFVELIDLAAGFDPQNPVFQFQDLFSTCLPCKNGTKPTGLYEHVAAMRKKYRKQDVR